MHIIFFSHYFPPEGNAPASRTYEHCVRWVRAGHDVTVITCVPNVPNGVPYYGYKNRWRQEETVDGIRVIRVWTYLAPNAGVKKRVFNFVSYMFAAIGVGLFVKRPDVVIATSPQFFCGLAGMVVQAIRRLPFVLEIRDIWPESITAVGAMKRGRAIQFLEWLEKKMYASADHIVAVGQGYQKNVISKASPEKVSVIYNGVDGDKFEPQRPDSVWLKEQGLSGKFVCAYIGTIGLAHGLETVLDAAEMLKSQGRNDIAFLLVGDGANRIALEENCCARGLEPWVRFTGRLDKSEMPKVTASSDALLVHLKPCDLFQTVIPSKIFEAMAMQRPIIMGVQGESAEIVKRAKAGIEMEPGNAQALVDCVTRLCDAPELRGQLSSNGRQFVLQEFSRDRFADQFLILLDHVIRGQNVPSGLSVIDHP